MNRIHEKIASFFAHTTSAKNLEKILELGKLMPLKQLAKEAPEAMVNVEKDLTSFTNRATLDAMSALKSMQKYKDVDKLHFTRNGYLPHYGDHIITYNDTKLNKKLAPNLVPEEYVFDKPISINDKRVAIFVPDEKVKYWKKKRPDAVVKPLSEYIGKRYSRFDGFMSLPEKAFDAMPRRTKSLYAQLAAEANRLGLGRETLYGAGAGVALGTANHNTDSDLLKLTALGALLGTGYRNIRGLGGFIGNKIPHFNPDTLSQKDVRRIFGPDAILAGSEGLGIAVPGSSDVDVMLPYKTRYFFNRAIEQLKHQFPDAVASPFNKGKLNKAVYTINVGGKDIDLAFALGNKAFNFRKAYINALNSLTDEQKLRIIQDKERLKNALFFRNKRYKRYKNRLANDLGLRQYYF